ncbi:MAG: response regulator transcription factor [Treponema sp.]|jgi:DNA-binding response OmpR family regulator|nr:response regulator transcription factor [Treponema sp.]
MKRILIAEDDTDIAELERDYLQLNGWQADIETDGIQTLKRISETCYDVLIVDLMLPGCSGFDIIKKTREQKEIPVLVVSARTEDIDKIRGFELGADDYLVKPFSPAELVARVKSHLARYERLSGNTATSYITAGNLEVNLQSHKVLVNDTETVFTSTEYALLVFLAANPNRVFTREQLFSAVWGSDYAGDLATVAVHIQKIRKKIERDPSNPVIIETLWGTGYRFNRS